MQDIYSQQRDFLQILQQGFPHMTNEIKGLQNFQRGLKRLDKAIGKFYDNDEIVDEINGD